MSCRIVFGFLFEKKGAITKSGRPAHIMSCRIVLYCTMPYRSVEFAPISKVRLHDATWDQTDVAYI